MENVLLFIALIVINVAILCWLRYQGGRVSGHYIGFLQAVYHQRHADVLFAACDRGVVQFMSDDVVVGKERASAIRTQADGAVFGRSRDYLLYYVLPFVLIGFAVADVAILMGAWTIAVLVGLLVLQQLLFKSGRAATMAQPPIKLVGTPDEIETLMYHWYGIPVNTLEDGKVSVALYTTPCFCVDNSVSLCPYDDDAILITRRNQRLVARLRETTRCYPFHIVQSGDQFILMPTEIDPATKEMLPPPLIRFKQLFTNHPEIAEVHYGVATH